MQHERSECLLSRLARASEVLYSMRNKCADQVLIMCSRMAYCGLFVKNFLAKSDTTYFIGRSRLAQILIKIDLINRSSLRKKRFMMSLRLTSSLALFFALSSVVTVQAADNISYSQHHSGFYMSLNTIPPVTAGLYAGYMMTTYWGVEAGVDAVWGFDLFCEGSGEIYHLDVKGVLPLGSRAELFGKLGVGVIHAEENDDLLENTESSTGVGATFGLGFGYDFTPTWVATAELNGIAHQKSPVLNGTFSFIPTIGITHYFSV